MGINVLAITVKPVLAAETRYRIFQYIQPFRSAGIKVEHLSFVDNDFYRLHTNAAQGRTIKKLFLYIFFYMKMFSRVLAGIHRYDVVWICREVSPIGPPFFEKLFFLFNKKVILDIDDAIYLHDPASKSVIHNHLRDFDKFRKTGHLYAGIVCGNRVLERYFKALNTHVSVIPTVVPIYRYQKIRRTKSSRPRIGWIGTPTNYCHFDLVKQAFDKLALKYDFQLEVVGLGRNLDWPGDYLVITEWDLDKELDYFSRFDIGIMPLADTRFSRGKCAFKIIQYMAAGIPVVASPVGANKEVVTDGVNGFLAASSTEWYERLECLIKHPKLRDSMGKRGVETVRQFYSLESQWRTYAKLFKNL